MMVENLRGDPRPTSLGYRDHQSRQAVRRSKATSTPATHLPETVPASAIRAFDRAALLTAIRQIAVAIRRWRQRARSRQRLHELNDHLLKDIGLRREDVIYRVEKCGDLKWTR